MREVKKQPRKLKNALLVLVILALISVAAILLVWPKTENKTSDNAISAENTAPIDAEQRSPVPVEVAVPEDPVLFDQATLQTTIDTWSNSVSGSASVVVADVDGTVLAESNGDQSYFAASIYKLYVAYFGYQQVDAGLVDSQEIYSGSRTRGECLDLMIRESDSPCGEKMLAELNQQEPADNDPLGIEDRVPIRLEITSSGVAELLRRVATGDGLSDTSHQALLESMRLQVYRDALNKGFSDSVTVYNKIGFRDFDEYHDVAIVELADGRRFVLSVLTDGVGTRNIADLGAQIESIVLK